MRFSFSFFIFLICVLQGFTQVREKIDVTDFGAHPNDGRDDTGALRQAVKRARETEGSTLVFPPGKYLLSDPKAIQIQEAALHGKFGENPQNHLYVPNRKYVIGLDFKGAKDLTILAEDVELMCDGWMEPLSFRDCENINLTGLTIDYKQPPNSAGKVIRVTKKHIDVLFPENNPVSADLIMPRVMLYNTGKKSFTGISDWLPKHKLIAPQTIRFYSNKLASNAGKGTVLVAFSGFHYRPAILIYKTKNITLNDVSIHAQAGMGIVGHLSENITMNRLKIIPRKGRYVSTNTDATHFASNRGFIRFNNCEFGGHGDDATNVHTYYMNILERPDNNTCITHLGERNFTHSLYQDEPQTGDTLAVVVKNTLKEVGYIKVLSYTVNPEKRTLKIHFEGDLPKDYKSFFLINTSACPSLYFTNNTVHSHRARSVLVKTRKVLIEGCKFENTTGTAIHIGAEGDWGEGPASQDVIVRNNRFSNCGIGGEGDGTLDGASAVAIHVKAKKTDVPGLHKRILIENNVIKGGIRAISVKGAQDVLIRNNTFINIELQPILIGSSIRVKATDNTGAKPAGENENPALPNTD